MNIQLIYKALRAQKSLTENHLLHMRMNIGMHTPPQCASLLIALVMQTKIEHINQQIIKVILDTYPNLQEYVDLFLNPKIADFADSIKSRFMKILAKTYANKTLTQAEIAFLFQQYQTGKLDDVAMAVWLMTVSYRTISKKNIEQMSHLCRDSGKVFDYRNLPGLANRKIISRYPTGALSEKTALIMPSLLCVFAEKYPIASNFLVAKTLAFTGGTWDKLSVIPNFTFPKQGAEVIQALQACHVAMSVTVGDFNPLDEKLYQLRSATGSVESIPLIAVSVASKLLAIPLDFLLLDIRFGAGAFAASLQAGKRLEKYLKFILSPDIAIEASLTQMNQPNGMAIGNLLELIEAIAVIKNEFDHPLWDKRALAEQQVMVCRLFSQLMHRVFPEIAFDQFMQEAKAVFDEKKVIGGFKKLLAVHGVSPAVIDTFVNDPESLLKGYVKMPYLAPTSGILKAIEQKNLGFLANFEFSTGLNRFVPKKENGLGLILKKRLGDFVKAGEPLCEVLVTEAYALSHAAFISAYLAESFYLEPDA